MCAYDIEALETTEGVENLTNVVGIHKIVSLAISTNRGHSKCFVRADSSHQAVQEMISDACDYLERINQDYEAEVPEYFTRALENLASDVERTKDKIQKRKVGALKTQLENYLKLQLFGYNSGEYFFLLIKERGGV